ncbi:uncharacterized protein TNCV_2871241 [Trichonephila clavipes]|nr:uncharacterized protein TNCV_2871241 [Trichonephila clavipes]
MNVCKCIVPLWQGGILNSRRTTIHWRSWGKGKKGGWSLTTPRMFYITNGYALAHTESSVRDISKACSFSKSTMWDILHAYGAYPYRPDLEQELMPGDQERHFDFYNFVLKHTRRESRFFNEVLWSDE